MLKGGTQRMRESAFYRKEGREGGVLIDGWAHVSCQERKLSEKSNSAWCQNTSQFQQESHLWYLGEWASFYPSLPCVFLDHSLIDSPINHALTTQTEKCARVGGWFCFFPMMYYQEFTKSASNKICFFGQLITSVLFLEATGCRLVTEVGMKWKDCWFLFPVWVVTNTAEVWFDLLLAICGRSKIDLQ